MKTTLRLSTASVAVATAATLAMAAAPAASAAPAPTVVAAPEKKTEWVYGWDSEYWKPSHAESTRIIPICQGPVAFLKWLEVNFGDHGKDLAGYVKRNTKALEGLATGKINPILAPILVGILIVEIPVYALSDTIFHVPATAYDVLTLCSSVRKGHVNTTIPAG